MRPLSLIAALMIAGQASPGSAAVPPHASWHVLSFTNGFSAHTFDTQLARIKSFREHLYDHVSASQATAELAYDSYFGLRDEGHDAWLGETPIDHASYVPGTGIVRVTQHVGVLQATGYYFAPYGYDGPALAMLLEVTNTGTVPEADGAVFSLHNFPLADANQSTTWDGTEFVEQGVTSGRTLVLIPLTAPTAHACTPNNPYTAVKDGGHLVDTSASGVTTNSVEGYEWSLDGLAPGSTEWFGVLLGYSPSGGGSTILPALRTFVAGRDAATIEQAEEAQWSSWHASEMPPTLSGDEQAVYQEQTAILRMGQVREPDPTRGPGPNGEIVASLPPGIWDIAWVRDQALATLALVRSRHLAEARAALAFLAQAQAGSYVCCDAEGGPYVGAPYRISVVRYTGAGVEESDSNADGPNVEFDGFGLTLLAAQAYVESASDDTLLAAMAPVLFQGDADVLVSLVDGKLGILRADSSIWEEHWENGGRKHFLYSDAAAAAGLRAAAQLALRAGDRARATQYAATAEEIASGIAANQIDPASGALMADLEEPADWIDAAVVDAFNWDVLDGRGPTAAATMVTVTRRLFDGFTGHGYIRNDDGSAYDNHEWVLCDLRIATALRRLRMDADSDALLGWVTAQAQANYDEIPENYDEASADYAGQVPMVGFGAGAYVLALHDRADEMVIQEAGSPRQNVTLPASAPSLANTGGCSVSPGPSRPPGSALILLALGVLLIRTRRIQRRTRSRLRALAVLALVTPGGCGFEQLFNPPTGFDPTPPPRVVLSVEVGDIPSTPAGSMATPFTVTAYDSSGTAVAATLATPGTAATLDLGTGRDFDNLRLAARRGDVVLRAVVPSAHRGKPGGPTVPIAPGTIDASSTAAAILIERKLDPAGIGSVPSTVVAKLLSDISAPDPKRDAFRALVATILSEGSAVAPADATPCFGPVGDGDLAQAFLDAHGDTDPTHAPATWAALRDQAAGTLTVDIVCDPAFVRVLFTVDMSGRGKDGVGAAQLIRQSPKAGAVYLGITVDPSSPIADVTGALPPKIVPNNPSFEMVDDGTNGDEVAGDGIYSITLTLPRGMRVIYKYTDGAAGDGFSGSGGWPGNARILEVDDILTSHSDGSPDCVVVRRDAFGDEASNKNFVNLNPALAPAGGALGWDVDLGGSPAIQVGGLWLGGLALDDDRLMAPLSPQGVPEARENGVCTRCPPPLVVTASTLPPELESAAFDSTGTVTATFSEGLDFASAEDPSHYLILDELMNVLPITSVAADGSKVELGVSGPDYRSHYTLFVQGVVDASLDRNPIAPGAHVPIGPDVTPPTPIAARAASLKDYDPAAVLPDATVGQGVVVSFDEQVDPVSAQDATRYSIETTSGLPLTVHAAYLTGPRTVFLVTDPQEKGRGYTVKVEGVRDFAGNLESGAPPLAFTGFALYHVRFGVVPGFAFASQDGAARGLPPGENLYLTGTPLGVARDAAGEDISIPGRTDVTGVPEFQMLPTTDPTDQVDGQPVYRISLLLPPGVYAWKPAHGIAGEWKTPPVTLEKVEKDLATTNDATGVSVDPRTLVARDGTSFSGAKLSLDGRDAPGPHVLFKRENPDEICMVQDADTTCPTVVVSTWRDLPFFYVAGRLDDYDDGVLALDPFHDLPDTSPPKLLSLIVRDSESILLSFDKAVVPAPGGPSFSAIDSAGAPLGIVGTFMQKPTPHEIVVQTATQGLATSYALTYGALSDPAGHAMSAPLTANWVSPPTDVPFTPLDDHTPPAVTAVQPASPTSVKVSFSKAVAASTATPAHFAITAAGAVSPPTVLAVSLTGAGKVALLTTSPQTPSEPYSLTVTNLADLATPPNVLVSQSASFLGFGDTTPPMLENAWSMGPTQVGLLFSKDLDSLSAELVANYAISGLTVTGVEFSGDPAVVASAFDQLGAPFVRDIVVLDTTPQTSGASYTVQVAGVNDLSGNTAMTSATFRGRSTAPTVDVELDYLISQGATVAGLIPPRAISPAVLSTEREGVFILGSGVSLDGATTLGTSDPATMQLGGFPPEGSPISGPVPELVANPTLGASWYTLTVHGVPLGETIEWKAFASYTVAYQMSHPCDPAAAFANAAPGPSAFADGQEYPGNEDGARIVGDLDGDGKVVLQVLFGDETTYKKLTGHAAFVWTTDSFKWSP